MPEEPPNIDDLRQALVEAGRSAPPRVAQLATWLHEDPQEVAFNSVRGLAERAGVNANTVVRLSQAMGFQGYDALRRAFQDAMRQSSDLYSRRAEDLRGRGSGAVLEAVREAAHRNIDAALSDQGQVAIQRTAALLLGARRVHAIGVRSCFALADYLGYTGRMAFGHFAERVSTPGDIIDSVAATGPGDVVVAITFPHYSMETVRAHDLALRQGAALVAITDGLGSPVARGAEIVLTPQMHGPQPLPSMVATFALIEALIAAMVARSDTARDRIAEFETRLMGSGAYYPG